MSVSLTCLPRMAATVLLGLAAVGAGAGLVQAQEYRLKELEISAPHARASRPGVLNSSAYFAVTNHGQQADRLVSASSPVAERTELHDMKIENDVMRMFQVEGIELPAGQSLTLGQGNKLHVMLMQLKQPLQAGQTIALTLQFEQAGTIDIQVPVKEHKIGGHEHHGHGHGDGHAEHGKGQQGHSGHEGHGKMH
ncbi:copper chaperone PCu(A)C [Vandammella animalimorsus]|nr:copper chaperone PCu(A)C [Vandammella animalimorsus]